MKVFIIHGFQGAPNGGWRPWLMAELEKQNIYACALSMKDPDNPICNEWIHEIARYVEMSRHDEIYLVGHSLGVPAILRYLEGTPGDSVIKGAVLISGPSEKNDNRKIDSFLDKEFNFKSIKSQCKAFAIIHGDNDTNVPLSNARMLSQELEGSLTIVKDGGHLNGSAGWFELPQCLEALNKMMKL